MDVDDVISVVEALLVTSESGKSVFLGFELDDRNLGLFLVSTEPFDSVDNTDLFGQLGRTDRNSDGELT